MNSTKGVQQKLNILIFHPILMHIFGKMIIFMGYWWTINFNHNFISKRGIKEDQILKFRLFGRYIKHFKWSNVQNKMGQAIYCAKQNTVSTVVYFDWKTVIKLGDLLFLLRFLLLLLLFSSFFSLFPFLSLAHELVHGRSQELLDRISWILVEL